MSSIYEHVDYMNKDSSFPLTAMETTPRWLLNHTLDGDVR